MESSSDPTTTATVDRDAAAAALAEARRARSAIGASVSYPPGYVPLMAFTGFAIPILAVTGTGELPNGWLQALFLVVGFSGVVASGWALHLFQSHNGVRITGLQSGKRYSVTYMVVMLALLIGVASAASTTGAWWVSLVAAPIGAAITLVFIRVWLTDLHRHTA